MGKRKNRSKAMCLAAKRRGVAPKQPGGGPSAAADSTKQKIVFGDDDGNDNDDQQPTMTNVPPPPPQQHQQQQRTQTKEDQIVLPRTNAPWFARTLSAVKMQGGPIIGSCVLARFKGKTKKRKKNRDV